MGPASFRCRYVRSDRVDGPTALHGQTPDLDGFAINGSGWRREDVDLLAEEQDDGCQAEHDRGAEVGQPEPDIFLGIDHGNLAAESADVDHEVEVVIDAGDSCGGIDDDTLALFGDSDERSGFLVLFRDESGDVGPESVSFVSTCKIL